MNNTKQLVFLFLLITFIFYSVTVYMDETNIENVEKYLTDDARQGKLLFQQYNCIACHQIFGLGGYMGHDLTNVISAKGKGELYAAAFIKNGTLKMPDFHFSDDNVKSIVAYLTYLDKTGTSPPKDFDIMLDGTIEIR